MRKITPRSKYTPGNFLLHVRRSKTGRGLFTAEDIRKGACILEYTGRKLSKKETEEKSGKYYFDTGAGTIDGNVPANTARYINHSCKPNCEPMGPRGKVYIMARRRIKAGEELTYDYGKEYFNEFLSDGRCRCSACTLHTKRPA